MKERDMRHAIRLTALAALAMAAVAGCTIPPHPGMLVPPAAEVVPVDARVTMYGLTLDEAIRNPAIAERVRAMFGPDWAGGQFAPTGARTYFVGNTPPRRIRIGGTNYIAYMRLLDASFPAPDPRGRGRDHRPRRRWRLFPLLHLRQRQPRCGAAHRGQWEARSRTLPHLLAVRRLVEATRLGRGPRCLAA